MAKFEVKSFPHYKAASEFASSPNGILKEAITGTTAKHPTNQKVEVRFLNTTLGSQPRAKISIKDNGFESCEVYHDGRIALQGQTFTKPQTAKELEVLTQHLTEWKPLVDHVHAIVRKHYPA